MTASIPGKAAQGATAPRAAAVAGILFALLFGASIVLMRLSVPADLADPSAWTPATLSRAALGMRVIPFAGILFLWFVGVIRDQLGAAEDKFFATVTLGSALVFVALTFAAFGVAGGLFESYHVGGLEAWSPAVYLFGRSVVDQIFNTYAVKMASVFMFSLGTLWRSTGVMPRSFSLLTYALAVIMLVVFSRSLWILLVFPAWVLLVSVYILISNLRPKGS